MATIYRACCPRYSEWSCSSDRRELGVHVYVHFNCRMCGWQAYCAEWLSALTSGPDVPQAFAAARDRALRKLESFEEAQRFRTYQEIAWPLAVA